MRTLWVRAANVAVLVAAIAAGAVGASACDRILGLSAIRVGCTEGDVQCFNNTPQHCDSLGNWIPDAPCAATTCIDGACRGQCTAGSKTCDDKTNTPLSCNPQGEWAPQQPCAQSTCVMGECEVACSPGDLGCSTDTNTPQICNANRAWQNVPAGPCVSQTCNAGLCVGECSPGKRCADDAPQVCDENGVWIPLPACDSSHYCEAGECLPSCTPGDVRCLDSIPQRCNALGQWETTGSCTDQACFQGECVGVCAPGAMGCSGNTPQTCDAMGQWQDRMPCIYACAAGICTGPNCSGLPDTCGPAQNENCCLSPVVAGGTYNRSNHAAYPATVSDFRLDRFEVTVGRFRNFVNAYPGSKPPSGAGAHPKILNSGWYPEWDMSLPPTQNDLKKAVTCPVGTSTWTDSVGQKENLPINCLNWYIAFAFCAWDGGRLPTEAEWNYAAAAGMEQRIFPWSDPPSSQTIDDTYAVHDCLGNTIANDCILDDILAVGSRSPNGDGKWGQADLAGSVSEWILDAYAEYMVPCDDCAKLTLSASPDAGASPQQITRGGSWHDTNNLLYLFSSYRLVDVPTTSLPQFGVRCARDL